MSGCRDQATGVRHRIRQIRLVAKALASRATDHRCQATGVRQPVSSSRDQAPSIIEALAKALAPTGDRPQMLQATCVRLQTSGNRYQAQNVR